MLNLEKYTTPKNKRIAAVLLLILYAILSFLNILKINSKLEEVELLQFEIPRNILIFLYLVTLLIRFITQYLHTSDNSAPVLFLLNTSIVTIILLAPNVSLSQIIVNILYWIFFHLLLHSAEHSSNETLTQDPKAHNNHTSNLSNPWIHVLVPLILGAVVSFCCIKFKIVLEMKPRDLIAPYEYEQKPASIDEPDSTKITLPDLNKTDKRKTDKK